MRHKNGQVLNKAPFCKSRLIYISILLYGLVGSGMGFFFLGEPVGRVKIQRQDKISHDSTR